MKDAGATRNDRWSAPIHFVTGYLKGAEWYGIDELTTARPKPPKPGLFKIDLDIPQGAKANFLAGGVQIKIRGVEILVSEEVNPNHWVGCDDITNHQPTAPHLREILDDDLSIGVANAKRIMLQNINTHLVLFSRYLMKLPTFEIEAIIFTKRQTGIDLAKYEPILASIRPKQQ